MKTITFLLWASSLAHGWTLTHPSIKGWSGKTLTFHVNPTNCLIDRETLYSVIDESLNAWNGVPHASLMVTRASLESTQTAAELNAGSATDVPLIACDPNFEATTKADADYVPAAAFGAHTSSDYVLRYGGVYLNGQAGSGAELSRLNRTELVITLSHEIGHVLGLGHSSRKEALMYFSIAAKPAAVLAQDDMDGMAFLYPRNEFKDGQFGCGAVHRNGFHPPILSLLLSIGFLGALIGLGRWTIRPGRLPGFRG